MHAVTVPQLQTALNEWLETPGLTLVEASFVRSLRDHAKKGSKEVSDMARALFTMMPDVARSAVAKARAAGIGKEWPLAR